jgi:hypothetical protein
MSSDNTEYVSLKSKVEVMISSITAAITILRASPHSSVEDFELTNSIKSARDVVVSESFMVIRKICSTLKINSNLSVNNDYSKVNAAFEGYKYDFDYDIDKNCRHIDPTLRGWINTVTH